MVVDAVEVKARQRTIEIRNHIVFMLWHQISLPLGL